jgi:F-type H+-transporting ATPase subunit epsilon
MLIDIVTPRGAVFSGEVDEVTAPGVIGELGFLPGHIPVISAIESGELAVRQGGTMLYFAVEGGFIEIARDKVNVITERALRPKELDAQKAEAELRTAEEALKKASGAGPAECETLVREFKRAEARLKVARRS